jgi:hypothetical protein
VILATHSIAAAKGGGCRGGSFTHTCPFVPVAETRKSKGGLSVLALAQPKEAKRLTQTDAKRSFTEMKGLRKEVI